MRKHISLPMILLVILELILNSCTSSVISGNILPQTGIYDGSIGHNKLIMVITTVTDEYASGYYIHNRKNPIETDHNFSISLKNNKLVLVSDEFNGTFSGHLSSSGLSGKINLGSKKLFFWKNKQMEFIMRGEPDIPQMKRYLENNFDSISVTYDIVYGHAQGYWTETPYLDDPYITIVARGMVNMLKSSRNLELKLDLYQPKNDSLAKRPLVVLVHGGGFYIGNKQSETEIILSKKLAKLGYVVASIDYRMGFKMKLNQLERSGYRSIQDVHAALRFLSHNAEKYGIDPEAVFVGGTSAGAMASLNVAFLDNSERPKCTFKQRNAIDQGNIESSGNNYTNKFNIKAVANMWGAVSDTLIITKDEQIPVISFHGNWDDIVPIGHDYPFQNTMLLNRLFVDKIYGSQPIHERLKHLGIENKLIVFETRGHEPQLENFKHTNSILTDIQNEIIPFFQKQIAPVIELKGNEIIIKEDTKLKPLNLEIVNGEIKHLEITGGLKISNKPDEQQIIWIKNQPTHQLTVFTNNKYDAWNSKSIEVILEQ